MRILRNVLLAGATIAVVGAVAYAADAPKVHVLTIPLPGGGVEQIRYTGDVAPKVVFRQAPDAQAALASEISDPVRHAAPHAGRNGPRDGRGAAARHGHAADGGLRGRSDATGDDRGDAAGGAELLCGLDLLRRPPVHAEHRGHLPRPGSGAESGATELRRLWRSACGAVHAGCACRAGCGDPARTPNQHLG